MHQLYIYNLTVGHQFELRGEWMDGCWIYYSIVHCWRGQSNDVLFVFQRVPRGRSPCSRGQVTGDTPGNSCMGLTPPIGGPSYSGCHTQRLTNEPKAVYRAVEVQTRVYPMPRPYIGGTTGRSPVPRLATFSGSSAAQCQETAAASWRHQNVTNVRIGNLSGLIELLPHCLSIASTPRRLVGIKAGPISAWMRSRCMQWRGSACLYWGFPSSNRET